MKNINKLYITACDFDSDKKFGLSKAQEKVYEFKIPTGISTYTFKVKLIFIDERVEIFTNDAAAQF